MLKFILITVGGVMGTDLFPNVRHPRIRAVAEAIDRAVPEDRWVSPQRAATFTPRSSPTGRHIVSLDRNEK